MLTRTKKSDRAKMVARLKTLNAACEFSSPCMPRGFHTYVRCAGGLTASVSIDGESRNCRDDAYVVAWFMESGSEAKLSDAFSIAIGSVNQYHRQKATSVVYGFDFLVLKLEEGIKMAANGRAFAEVESITA